MTNQPGPKKGGGIFNIIGGYVGLGYGFYLASVSDLDSTAGGLLGLGGFLLGAWLGYVLDNWVARLVLIAMAVLETVAIRSFVSAIWSTLTG